MFWPPFLSQPKVMDSADLIFWNHEPKQTFFKLSSLCIFCIFACFVTVREGLLTHHIYIYMNRNNWFNLHETLFLNRGLVWSLVPSLLGTAHCRLNSLKDLASSDEVITLQPVTPCPVNSAGLSSSLIPYCFFRAVNPPIWKGKYMISPTKTRLMVACHSLGRNGRESGI